MRERLSEEKESKRVSKEEGNMREEGSEGGMKLSIHVKKTKQL